ncbi:MAG: alkaline phosphatase family protein [Desulfarculaceae bacterium]|nr:alkaline phosphatase family protein [Desulfarculaceae bacterium]MCF8073786.1 alkaline phosphatase family protein [Desulfarculaceae bacterium]MCF8102027.1 alkaline phosphatase family protein [Desulfarculaceae bacterium]MCF8115997.1 alkaline phosphatase family protein [Desulfarculaceae bacterium]
MPTNPHEISRLIFLGLDGVGLDLASHLAGRGIMPRLGWLMERAGAWSTASPLPEVSPVCWTSMFSGLGPGGHGVFGFAEPREHAYGIVPADSSMVRAPRLWDLASAAGLTSTVLNVPLTYPPTPIQGSMVSGFVCPDLAGGVHPPGLLPRLQAMGYRPEAELETGREDPAALLADVARALAVRLELFGQMLAQDHHLFVGVVSDTDRVNHFAWPALWEPEHPLAPAALGVYQQVDAFIGALLERHGEDIERGGTALMIAADHSFGPIVSEVYLNQWLKQEGYLLVEGEPPGERILPATRALALDPGRIYLHTDRFPGGTVSPGPEAEALAAEIAAKLSALSFSRVAQGADGPEISLERPVARVHQGRDIYQGPCLPAAPELVAEAAPGYSLRGGLDRAGVFGLSHLSGTHRPRGALALMLPEPEGKPEHMQGLFGLMTESLGLKSGLPG